MAAKRRGNGEGTIQKKVVKWTLKDGTVKEKETWEGQIFLGHDKTGKMIRKSISGKSRKEVADKMKLALAEQMKGKLVENNRITIEEYFSRWLAFKKEKVKQSTYTCYELFTNNRIIPELGNIQLQKLTTVRLNDFYHSLSKEGLNPKTILKIHVLIGNALKLAEQEGIIGFNPSAKCQLPKVTDKKIEFLSAEESIRLLEAAKKYGINKDGSISKHHNFNMYPALLLALYTGIRRGELLGLKWKYVNFDNNTITISETLLQTKDGVFTDTPKSKTSKDRIISVPENVMSVLKEHQQLTGESEYVFATHEGGFVQPRNFNRAFELIVKNAGITKHIRVHDLRHSSASLLVKQNINPYVIQARLGHADIRTTQIYTHVLQESDKEAADKLTEILQK